MKFGFPMAFTVTILSWTLIEYKGQLADSGQIKYVKEAIKWGTDYFIKSHPKPFLLYGQVELKNSVFALFFSFSPSFIG